MFTTHFRERNINWAKDSLHLNGSSGNYDHLRLSYHISGKLNMTLFGNSRALIFVCLFPFVLILDNGVIIFLKKLELNSLGCGK